jgi:DNA-binding NarL/FixJ family response regulator
MSSVPVDPVPRVLVVDSDARTRESLAGLLGIGGRLVVVGSAGDAASAVTLAEELRPDIIVVDPRLPELDRGRALIARLRVVGLACRILVMNGAAAAPDGWSPIDADAYVRKTFRANELVDAVIAAGRSAAAS